MMKISFAYHLSGNAQKRTNEMQQLEKQWNLRLEKYSAKQIDHIRVLMIILEPNFADLYKPKRPKYNDEDKAFDLECWINHSDFMDAQQLDVFLSNEIKSTIESLRLPKKIESWDRFDFLKSLAINKPQNRER